MKVYLCGPINGCTDAECKDWREEIKGRWPDCIDPMVRDYRGREAECFEEIVELDKLDVALADAILVNYVKPSIGTAMEILFAWMLRKPIVLWCEKNAVISPWLRYHCDHIAHSLDDALRSVVVLTGGFVE